MLDFKIKIAYNIQQLYRGVEQLVARWAHNPKVIGSSPVPANTAAWLRWLEHAAHIRSVRGSSPLAANYFIKKEGELIWFEYSLTKESL